MAEEHQTILDAVLSKDAEAAVTLLVSHYDRTAEVILLDEQIIPELSNGAEIS